VIYHTTWKTLAVAGGCALALLACGKESGSGKAQGPAVLKVNEWSYTAADLEREIGQELRRAPRELQPFFGTKEGQKQFLDRVVRRELLLQEAEKRKLGDQADVAEQVANLRRELMIRALVQDEIGGKVKVEEKEVQEYFTVHPDEFSGDTVRLRHILVQTEGEAKEVQARLAKNEPFEDLAKKVSRDTNSAPKGGDLGYLGREQMLPDFAKAAFALKAGEVSEPVKTPFGFHLVKLVDRKKGQPMTFDQVKGQLQRRLLDERQAQRFQTWIKDLEGGAKITRDESSLPVGKFGPTAPTTPAAPPEDPKEGGKS
jgi:EpsD family peptidyl-prolyl cis-trans isomerase